MSRGGKRYRGPALALAVVAALWSPGAGAQQALELRPGLLEEDPTALIGEEPPQVPDAEPESLALPPQEQPQETRLTVAPEPPVEPPARARRAARENPHAPPGLNAGAFRLYPSLGIGGVYSDNVNVSPTAPESDLGLRVAPELRIESDWVRHALSLSMAGDFVFFEAHPENNDTDLDAAAALRLDVRHDTTLDLAAAYGLTESFGTASEVPATATSKRLDQTLSASVALGQRFGRLIATLTGEAGWHVYGNVEQGPGVTEINTDRNYVQPGVRLRVGYEVSPAVVPFAEVAYQPRIHELTVDRSGLRRDSQGGFARAGLAFDTSDIWSGEVALRYDYRDFDDSTLATVGALGLDASLVWRPSRLTSLAFTASTGLSETSTAGASAIADWTGQATLAHTLRDNIVLSAVLGANYASYRGIARDELTLRAEGAVSYLLSRNVELALRYAFTDFLAGTPGGDYVENRVSAGLRFEL